ncbi:MAG: general stress protein [Betaproteobacteria bacterium]|nr:MAG: general stress protein [Betaproteobacteria bacterium]
MNIDSNQKQVGAGELDARAASARLRAKIGEHAIAMVTATDRRYMPASRPLLTRQFDDDGVLWFFVPSDGSLALGIETNPRVSVTYSDPAQGVYVSLSGYARLVYDPDRVFALWDERVETWFRQGPLDPRLALLRVDLDHAEYWDERSRGMVRLLELAQAALRREPPMPATEHGRLKVRGGGGEARRA